MNQIEKALKEASETNFWGSIEIQYHAGKPTVIRKIQTERIDEGNNLHDKRSSRS